MSTGRKPILAVIDGRRPHRSKDEVQARVDAEPRGCKATFKAPKEMSPDARKEWRRVVALYKQLDSEVLNDLDLSVLSAYCESVAIYRKAQEQYQKFPLYGKNLDTGQPVENPYIKIMNREGQNVVRYAEQLCLSPVGRARMGLAREKREAAQDPMEEVLQRRLRRDVL
jgi:P27 family predicted phage terminase small subunit